MTVAGSRLRADPPASAPACSTLISHGCTVTATGPEPASVLTTRPPPSRSTAVSPSSAWAVPVSTTAPVRSATNADAGAAASSVAEPGLHHRPAVEHGHAVGQQGGLAEVVGDHQHRHAGGGDQGGQLPARPRPGGGVQGRQRLVQQQHLGLARQRPGQRHALALAAGQGGRAGVGAGGQAEAVEQLVGALAPLRARARR